MTETEAMRSWAPWFKRRVKNARHDRAWCNAGWERSIDRPNTAAYYMGIDGGYWALAAPHSAKTSSDQ